jgi:hypothetical protein
MVDLGGPAMLMQFWGRTVFIGFLAGRKLASRLAWKTILQNAERRLGWSRVIRLRKAAVKYTAVIQALLW